MERVWFGSLCLLGQELHFLYCHHGAWFGISLCFTPSRRALVSDTTTYLLWFVISVPSVPVVEPRTAQQQHHLLISSWQRFWVEMISKASSLLEWASKHWRPRCEITQEDGSHIIEPWQWRVWGVWLLYTLVESTAIFDWCFWTLYFLGRSLTSSGGSY